MIGEILSEIAKEIVASPLRMVAEVVQFVVLVGIIWVVAFGFGNRRGFVVNMLDERQQRVHDWLGEASKAEGRLEAARVAAEQRLADARIEADKLRSDVQAEVVDAESVARANTDDESERMVERAHAALTNEQAQMQTDVRDELVELVSEATRSIMNEALSVAEQRDRIESAIVDGVSGVTGHSAARRGRRPAAPAASAAEKGV